MTAFGTANGNISFVAFANMIADMWNEAHEDIPFYQEGSANSDVSYPVIVWKNAGRSPVVEETGHRKKLIETVTDEFGEYAYTKRIGVTRNTFRVTVKATDPDVADQIIEMLEDFVEEVTGALMKLGIKRVMYAGRVDLDPTKDQGKTLNHRRSEWVVHEQRTTVVKESTIQEVEMRLRAVTEEREGEDFITSSVSR